jgi:uncharacterized protein (TIGR04141 family)
MVRPPRLRKLTFSLLKEERTMDDAIREGDDIRSFRVPSIDADRDTLFLASRAPHPPWWEGFLDPHVDGSLDGVLAASASGALLLAARGRLFAVTFGQGRYLLEPDAFEPDFGLKIVLNVVAPDQLKSFDAKTIEETTLHTRRDVSRDSTLAAFDIDTTRDLLRSVTGTPQDNELANRLSGADAVGLNTRAQVPDLPALAARLLDAYTAEDYKINFEFIDYLRPEKRAGRLRDLEQRLVDALNLREIDDVHLAWPEPLDWLDVEGLRFSTQPADAEPNADPRISTYLAAYEAEERDVGLKDLKRDRMIAVPASGDPRSWPVFRCLVYQVEIDDELYVLSAGDWYRVSLAFKDKVYAYVNGLPALAIDLPDADAGTDEDAYNIKAAAAIDALCLDRKFVYDGGPDKMEICDLLTRDGVLIHVKQRGSSSTLSHLFGQGLNCAERLLEDPDFRTRARAVAAAEDASFADVLPDDQPIPQTYEVSFVVITRSTRDTPLTLPFFSVVSLRSAAMRLRALGFRVSVATVNEPSREPEQLVDSLPAHHPPDDP